MKVLLINQTFYPDVVATAQYLVELGSGLQQAGHEVSVLTSSRGYDDPTKVYSSRENWQGIWITRIMGSGFGKSAKWRRLLDFSTFWLKCLWRLLWMPKFELVVALTSPPLISVLAAFFVKIKGGKFVYWVMDLNPDEAVAAGWISEGSYSAKFLELLSRFSLRHANRIVVLDRFMESRILEKGIDSDKLNVVPPWSNDGVIAYDEQGRRDFRTKYALSGKFVVMYSGNHSPCHPLDTLLEAAWRFEDENRIAFVFIGGGSELLKVKAFCNQHKLENMICLPYQPIDKFSGALSAGDLQVVVMGDPFIGMIHPCKIYNILAIGSRFLYIGPNKSHVTDIVDQNSFNGRARLAQHGDVDRVVSHISDFFAKWQEHAPPVVAQGANFYSRDVILPRLIKLLES